MPDPATTSTLAHGLSDTIDPQGRMARLGPGAR